MKEDSASFAEEVWFDIKHIYIKLKDCKTICVTLDRFQKLKKATKKQRENYRFVGYGYGIHWEGLDEGILVEKPSLS